jgi:hypothetical protein
MRKPRTGRGVKAGQLIGLVVGRRRKPCCTRIEQMAYEVEWYEKHGKYPDRIKEDSLGHRFVEWDRGWNSRNQYRRETIWKQLADHVQFRITGVR